MTIWVSIGTSPSAGITYQNESLALAFGEYITTITTNAGILIEPTPNYYWLQDSQAVRLYHEHARIAREHGTKICTGVHAQSRHVRDADIAITVPVMQISGTLCLWFAVQRGATEIHAIGYEGYGPENDLYESLNAEHAKTVNYLIRKTRGVTTWKFYGDLKYELDL